MKWFHKIGALLCAATLFVGFWDGLAHATVTSPTVTITANGNGSTTNFNYNFIVPYQADGVTPAVTVIYTDAGGTATTLLPAQYTISGVGNAAGGTVHYPLSGSPIASGTTLKITRNLAYIQPTAVNNNSFFPHTVEVVADNLDMQIQQLNARIGSSGPVTVNPLVLSDGTNTWQLAVGAGGNLNVTRVAGTGYINLGNGVPVYLPSLPGPYANDTVAASSGIAVGQLYRNGAVTQVRVN